MTILTNIDSNKCTYSEILFQISEKQKELLIVLIKEGKARRSLPENITCLRRALYSLPYKVFPQEQGDLSGVRLLCRNVVVGEFLR